MEVQDKTIIVTGGCGSLGLGISTALLARQAKVIIIDQDHTRLDALDKPFIKYHLDVTDYNAAAVVIKEIATKHGKIDALVNNAGVIYNEPLINLMNAENMTHSYANFKKYLDINLHSVFIMTSLVVEQMVLKRTKGAIINISSISAHGNAGQSAYAAAKAGVNALTKTWAKELGVWGIRSVAIAPGFIDTPSTKAALNNKTIERIKKETPLHKLGEIEDIARSVVYAIEDNYINGAVIDVNGGLTL